MSFQVVQRDITKMETDAIVNAANSGLQIGGSVCGAIFRVAGEEKMQEACDQYGFCPAGGAVITPGFDLPARYVIHARGPRWYGGGHGEEIQLCDAYRNSLILAEKHGLKSIAFPLISAGNFGFPKKKAMRAASYVIRQFLKETASEMEVYLVLYDWDAVEIGKKMFPDMKLDKDYDTFECK
ncbi:MAG: macro domain-containing protein [Lachnospiraceae bacterium]|nr:macro domain-containing protein [Lachnospiraceae bacterium]